MTSIIISLSIEALPLIDAKRRRERFSETLESGQNGHEMASTKKVTRTKTKKRTRVDAWLTFKDELKRYHDANGNCDVAQNYASPEGYKLGRAVGHIRSEGSFQIHKRNDRKEWLNSIGFRWRVRRARKTSALNRDRWKMFSKALSAFRARTGNCDVPSQHKELGYPLGRKVSEVRNNKTFLRGDASRTRLEFLNRLGFSWRNPMKRMRRRERTGEKRARGREDEGVSKEVIEVPVSVIDPFVLPPPKKYKRCMAASGVDVSTSKTARIAGPPKKR